MSVHVVCSTLRLSYSTSYILNRGWIDRDARRLPTYKEITGKGKTRTESEDDASSSDSDGEQDEHEDGVQSSLDEDEFDEVAERFETSYNFRFEEPYVSLS